MSLIIPSSITVLVGLLLAASLIYRAYRRHARSSSHTIENSVDYQQLMICFTFTIVISFIAFSASFVTQVNQSHAGNIMILRDLIAAYCAMSILSLLIIPETLLAKKYLLPLLLKHKDDDQATHPLAPVVYLSDHQSQNDHSREQ